MDTSAFASELAEFINNPHKANEPFTQIHILDILDSLCKTQRKLKITQIGSVYCILCERLLSSGNQELTLRCLHSFHRNCLKRKILVFTDNEPNEENCRYICCPFCDELVGLDIIKSKIFSTQEFEEIQFRAVQKLSMSIREEEIKERDNMIKGKKFECPVCMEEKLILTDCRTLECDHKICTECLKGEIMTKLNEGKVMEDDRQCPVDPKCSVRIDIALIQDLISKEDLDKYMGFTVINLKSNNPNEKYVRCPGKDCNYIFLYTIGTDTPFPTCIACQLKFCVNGCEKEHQGSTCEKYQEWRRENGEADQRFTNFVAANNLRPCPDCKNFVERNGGCNFMTCRCNTHFCYICGAKAISSHKCPNGHPTWS